MTKETKKLGDRGEDAAAAYLERTGMTLVERNWQCPVGEIDIIALDEECIVFVEVKTRKSARCGKAEESVTEAKQRRIGRLAAMYLAQSGNKDVAARFDVIGIHVLSEDRALLRHHRAAFIVQG